MTREVVWDHGVSLPGHRLWLDPLVVRSFAFISHAHTDHARRHKEALLTPQTLALIPESRRPRGWRMLGYGEPMRRDQGKVTLYPAGHMLGSMWSVSIRYLPNPFRVGFFRLQTSTMSLFARVRAT